MEKLKELVRIITPNKTKNITVIGNGKNRGTKLEKLYKILSSEEVTDEEVFKRLYPGSVSKNSYYKLKHELKERLYNSAFFIDAKKVGGGDRPSAYLRVQHLNALSAFFLIARAWQNANSTCKTALDIADKYEFTNEAINASRKLMMMSKTRGTKKELKKYSLRVVELITLQQKEIMAEVYWAQLGSAYIGARSYQESIVYRAENYGDMLDRIQVGDSTLKLVYNRTMIKATAKMAGHNFDQAIPILSDGLKIIENYPKFKDENFTYGISVNLLACHISRKNHPAARELLTSLYENIIPGAYNWYKTRELHFTLHMHTRHYAEAATLHADTLQQKTFRKQPAFIREAWAVYGAYLHILRLAGLLPEQEASGKRFRVSRYLNELPTYTKDKRGHNITVLLSQIILMLQRSNFDGLIDRFEAVNKYRERYVSREVNFRSNVFLHMLREVQLSDFDRDNVIAKTAALRIRLDEEPIDVINPGYDQEILPYEEVWELLVDNLK